MSEHRGDPARAPGSAWRDLAGGIAIAVIVGQGLWRGVLLARGWFGQSDFPILASAHDHSWGAIWSSSYAGSFSPGGWLLAWAHARIEPLGWALPAALSIAAEAVGAALLWIVLSRVLGGRWIRLGLLAWFCASPLTLWVTQWWTFSLPFWVATDLLLAAAWAGLVALESRSRRLAVLSVVALAGALVFDDRLWSAPVLLAVVAAALSPGETARARWRHLLVRGPRWLAALVGVVVVFLVVDATTLGLDLPDGGQSGDALVAFLRHALGELWGGPWQNGLFGHAFLVPHSWAVGASAVLLLALVAFTLQRGGVSARVAWSGLLVCLAMLLGLAVVQSGGGLLTAYGLAPRFAAECAVPFTLLSAVALRSVDLSRRVTPWLELGERTISVIVGVLVVASAAVSTAWMAGSLTHRDARDYVRVLEGDLQATPGAVLIDGPVPAFVMSPLYGPVASVATISSLIDQHPPVNIPSEHLQTVDQAGQLKPVQLTAGAAAPTPSDDPCGYHVTSKGVDVPLDRAVPRGTWVVRLGYYTSVESFATFQSGLTIVRFGVHAGLHEIDVPAAGPFTTVSLRLDDPAGTVCLVSTHVGLPVR